MENTLYDFVDVNEKILTILNRHDFQMYDFERIWMYRRYQEMIADGLNRKTVIYQIVKESGESESTVNRTIRKYAKAFKFWHRI